MKMWSGFSGYFLGFKELSCVRLYLIDMTDLIISFCSEKERFIDRLIDNTRIKKLP